MKAFDMRAEMDSLHDKRRSVANTIPSPVGDMSITNRRDFIPVREALQRKIDTSEAGTPAETPPEALNSGIQAEFLPSWMREERSIDGRDTGDTLRRERVSAPLLTKKQKAAMEYAEREKQRCADGFKKEKKKKGKHRRHKHAESDAMTIPETVQKLQE
ncbi:hypothetical protein C8F01DRAFT_1085236 [Mycena amicta]|nr:hypothetical protein C8F01DRAFT_1085236 [Mycena amicta]